MRRSRPLHRPARQRRGRKRRCAGDGSHRVRGHDLPAGRGPPAAERFCPPCCRHGVGCFRRGTSCCRRRRWSRRPVRNGPSRWRGSTRLWGGHPFQPCRGPGPGQHDHVEIVLGEQVADGDGARGVRDDVDDLLGQRRVAELSPGDHRGGLAREQPLVLPPRLPDLRGDASRGPVALRVGDRAAVEDATGACAVEPAEAREEDPDVVRVDPEVANRLGRVRPRWTPSSPEDWCRARTCSSARSRGTRRIDAADRGRSAIRARDSGA